MPTNCDLRKPCPKAGHIAMILMPVSSCDGQKVLYLSYHPNDEASADGIDKS